eukprot:scaffold26702_cov104-Skeletonema_menzelii.AAC.2
MKNFSGQGTITFDNGDVYDGAFRRNEPDGVGKLKYKDGRVCEGIWENGKIKYEGGLDENGKAHGRGKWMYSNGNVYEGEWKNGLCHGKGTYKWSNGDVHEGECKDDKMNGRGTYKWADGRSYEGEWKEDKKHGKGIEHYPDGSVLYDGEWKDDMPHGRGTYNYKNGDIYTGEWRADKMHGDGVMTYANQDIYDGQWKNHRKDGQGTMKYHNGDVYEGKFSNDKMHGKGSYTYAAGDLSKSIGEWKEGKKCGLFEDIVRVEVSEKVYYDNDEVKADSKVKREALDEDTDTEDAPPSKRSNVCVSPPQIKFAIVSRRLMLSEAGPKLLNCSNASSFPPPLLSFIREGVELFSGAGCTGKGSGSQMGP